MTRSKEEEAAEIHLKVMRKRSLWAEPLFGEAERVSSFEAVSLEASTQGEHRRCGGSGAKPEKADQA